MTTPTDSDSDSDQPSPAAALLLDLVDRIRALVHDVVDGASSEQLAGQPAGDANPVGWLIWHLTRVQDDHLAGAFDREQVWLADGWQDRFGLPLEAADTGYGHDAAQVGALAGVDAELLRGYHDAVSQRSRQLLSPLRDEDLSRTVDPNYDPPVTLATRLVSVMVDDLEHCGQAAYARGQL